jgi:hypothetical protein
MRPTNNQKKSLFVISCRLSKSLHWTIHQQECTPKNVATFSSKYHSPMEARNLILQGISCHHQKRRRSSKHWKAKVHVSNHICLKQDKAKRVFQTYPNIHITKPMTFRVLRQIKFNLIDIQSVLNQLLLPRINFLKHPWHINKKVIKTKTKNQIKHHHVIMRKLTKSNWT